MENLLCDEVLLSSPLNINNGHSVPVKCSSTDCVGLFHNNEQEFEKALSLSLEKEMSCSCMLEPNYVKYLHSNNLVSARFKVIQWFVKCKSRFGLSFGTVFFAANYLDRFICSNQCSEWKCWMVELLSVACLSVASKFNETSGLSLHEIQMEELEFTFESKTVLQMELKLLKVLQWRLNSVTAYSLMEILVTSSDDSFKPCFPKNLISHVTQLLLRSISDPYMLEFRQSILAISALWCSLDKFFPRVPDAFIASITKFFNQSQKGDLIKCHKMMEAQNLRACEGCCYYYCCPSSPTTVLLKGQIGIYLQTSRKRKIEES